MRCCLIYTNGAIRHGLRIIFPGKKGGVVAEEAETAGDKKRKGTRNG